MQIEASKGGCQTITCCDVVAELAEPAVDDTAAETTARAGKPADTVETVAANELDGPCFTGACPGGRPWWDVGAFQQARGLDVQDGIVLLGRGAREKPLDTSKRMFPEVLQRGIAPGFYEAGELAPVLATMRSLSDADLLAAVREDYRQNPEQLALVLQQLAAGPETRADYERMLGALKQVVAETASEGLANRAPKASLAAFVESVASLSGPGSAEVKAEVARSILGGLSVAPRESDRPEHAHAVARLLQSDPAGVLDHLRTVDQDHDSLVVEDMFLAILKHGDGPREMGKILGVHARQYAEAWRAEPDAPRTSDLAGDVGWAQAAADNALRDLGLDDARRQAEAAAMTDFALQVFGIAAATLLGVSPLGAGSRAAMGRIASDEIGDLRRAARTPDGTTGAHGFQLEANRLMRGAYDSVVDVERQRDHLEHRAGYAADRQAFFEGTSDGYTDGIKGRR